MTPFILKLNSFFSLCGSLFLRQLLLCFDPVNKTTTGSAYLYATGLILCPVIFILCDSPYTFECQHIGMQIRIASCSLLYKKCLRLSQKSLGKTGVGQMVNLMSNDVNRFDSTTLFLHYILIAPLQTLTTIVVLCYFVGWSCLIGMALLILVFSLQGLLSRVFSKLRLETAIRTDERIRTTNEILSGMRVIKMYTWEKPFAKLVELCRRYSVGAVNDGLLFHLLRFFYYLEMK